MITPNIKLSSNALTSAFPFHLIYDCELRIIQIGKSLQRLCPSLQTGDLINECFNVKSLLEEKISWQNLRGTGENTYILEHLQEKFRLRGQLLLLNEAKITAFLGTLAINKLEELQKYGLSQKDFAPHDLSIELLEKFDHKTVLPKSENEQNAGDVFSQINEGANLWRKSLTETLNPLSEKYQWGLGVLWYAEHEKDVLIGKHIWGNSPQFQNFRKEMQSIKLPLKVGLPGGVVDQTKPIWVEDVLTEGSFPPPYAVKHNIHGVVGIPIVKNQKIVGVIELFSHQRQVFNEHCLEDFVEICDQIGRDLEQKHLEDLFLEDFYRQREEAEKLEKAKDAAESANRAKSLFLANMSHEIRTPLNAIVGLTELVLETELDSEQKEFLGSIKINSEILLQIINDILDFSKVEAGQIELEETEFDLRELIEDVILAIYLKIEEKKLSLETNLSPNLPVKVIGDSQRIKQILLNLLSNAIKFTEQGKVSINLDFAEINSEKVILQVSVKDTGIGIAKEDLNKVFEKFTQSDSSINRRFGGTGLGLSICKSLVELMGGKMRVESEKNVGSSFGFEITLRKNKGTKTFKEVAENRFNQQEILLVSDAEELDCGFSTNLRAWNLRVEIADSIPKAFQFLSEKKYDLVIIDFPLQRETAVQLVDLIKTDVRLSNVKLLVFIPFGKWKKTEFKNVVFAHKSIRQKQMIELLSRVLHLKETANSEKIGKNVVKTVRKTDNFKILLVEDNRDNQQLGLKILEKEDYRVELAENGLEAIKAWEKNDFDLILMDLQMPLMSGIEAVKEIRRKEAAKRKRRVPILALTANVVKGVKENCLAVGMDDYLTKPLKKSDLLKKVNEYLDSSPRVLVAEDSKDVRVLIKHYLRDFNCRLTFAENGREALKLFEKEEFSLILLDMQMPILDGYETAEQLRRLGYQRQIVALTGYDGVDEKRKCLAAGCSDFLQKPFDAEKLTKLFKKHLNEDAESRSIVTASVKSFEKREASKESQIIVTVDVDIFDLIPEFLEERKKDIFRIREMVKKNDVASIKTISHQMKGCGEGYGFEEITKIGKAIEKAVINQNFNEVESSVERLEKYLKEVRYVPDVSYVK